MRELRLSLLRRRLDLIFCQRLEGREAGQELEGAIAEVQRWINLIEEELIQLQTYR